MEQYYPKKWLALFINLWLISLFQLHGLGKYIVELMKELYSNNNDPLH